MKDYAKGSYVIENSFFWFIIIVTTLCAKIEMVVFEMFGNRCNESKKIARCSNLTESIMMDVQGNWRLQRQLEIREKDV